MIVLLSNLTLMLGCNSFSLFLRAISFDCYLTALLGYANERNLRLSSTVFLIILLRNYS